MLETFYSEFISLKFLEAKREKPNNKFTVLNNATNFYNNELIPEYKKVYERESKDGKIYGWKQKYGPKSLKALDYQPVELETKSLSDENKLDLKQPTQLELLKLDEIRKPLWLKASRENFISLIKYVVDNLNSHKYKTSVNDLKNAESFCWK